MEDADITGLLALARRGDKDAEDTVLRLVYRTLEDRARALLHGQTDPSRLGPGTLVHEAFEKLFRSSSKVEFENRGHFYGIAAEAMRQVIVDHARRRNALIRGGADVTLPLGNIDVEQSWPMSPDDILAINEAYARLRDSAPQSAQVVRLRFFAGLTVPEISNVLGVSDTTVETRWRLAKAFLHRELTGGRRRAAGK